MMAVASFCPGYAVDVGQCAVELGWLFGGEGVSFLSWFRLVLIDEGKVSVFAIMAGF